MTRDPSHLGGDDEGPFADADERLLEFALCELHRAEPAPDLTPEIVAAWERGERGSAFAGEHAPPPEPEPGAGELPVRGAPLPLVSRWSRPAARWTAAAAAGIALLLGAGWWTTRGRAPSSPLPTSPAYWNGAVALAPATVELVRAPGSNRGPGEASGESSDGARDPVPVPAGTLRLLPGDLVRAGGGVPARIELAGRGRIELAAGGVLAFEPLPPGAPVAAGPVETDLRLRLGAVAIRTPGAGALATDFARIEWDAARDDGGDLGVELGLRIDPDDAVFAGRELDPLGADRELVLGAEPFSRLLTLEVRRGRAVLVRASGERETLTAGRTRVLASEPGRLDTVSRADQERLGELLRVAMPGYDWKGTMVVPKPPPLAEAELALEDLIALLGARPERWGLLRAFHAETRALDWTGAPVPARFVDLLALEGSDTAVAWARELWLESPESFGLDARMALADRGAFELERELRAMVRDFDGEDPAALALPAARLAFAGDDLGREVLLTQLDRTWDAGKSTLASLVAAAALAEIGDESRWRLERVSFAEQIRSTLDDGGFETARRMATEAGLLLEELARAQPPRLAYFERRVAGRLFLDGAALADPATVRAFADRLAAG